ncbi:MAG: hypothetical protein Q7R95_08545 [bacterium]|nr:hypothetical protein [bacterium]
MEEIKNLFIKHFGFFPDIISTTEHAYISPPSRIISSLIKLSEFLDKKVLRIVITDTYAIHPENYVNQICIPHILSKKLFIINNLYSSKEFSKHFREDIKKIKDIVTKKDVFSFEEKKNYIKLINLYKKVFKNIKKFDSVDVYNNIIKLYADDFKLDTLNRWLSITKSFGVDSIKIRIFLKEAFDILRKDNLLNITLFGKYLEMKKRLKMRNSDNDIKFINWDKYLEELCNTSNFCSIPFEIILYIYSYGGGSHFGNDYGMVDDINKMRNNKNLLQITEHNKDFSFKIEEKNVQFQKISLIKGEWALSHRMYKSVDSLSELYIVLGQDTLKLFFKGKRCQEP